MTEKRVITVDRLELACRAWDPQDYPTPLRELWNKAVADMEADGLPTPPLYPGSIKQRCRSCGIDVCVGPRQQEAVAVAERGGRVVLVRCLLCSMLQRLGEPAGQVVMAANLGNPFQPEKARE